MPKPKPKQKPEAQPLDDADRFLNELEASWQKDMASIDAWLARERAELDALFSNIAPLSDFQP